MTHALSCPHVARILATWSAARAAGIAPGWYWREGTRILNLATHHNRALSPVVCAASALSPRVQWERVIPAGLSALLRGRRPTGFPGRSIEKARACLDAPDGTAALALLTGPKTHAFARALLGHDEPVIDVWSARVAGFDPERLTPKRYRAAADAYRRAAEILRVPGLTPARDVQEVTWQYARTHRIPTEVLQCVN